MRRQLIFSQEDVAKMVSEALGKSIGRSTIAKIENGIYEPRYTVAVKKPKTS